MNKPIFFNDKSSRKPGFRWVMLAFYMTLVVVALGAFTRLVDAGLGCPDWPGCYGHLLWPTSLDEIATAEANFNETVDHSKTWPEMVHRYFAAGLGLIILIVAVYAIKVRFSKKEPNSTYPLRLPLGLLLLVILQGAFGRWTVTLDLWPQVVTAHLIGGFSTLVLIWLLAQRLAGPQWSLNPSQWLVLPRLRFWVWCLLIVIIGQILLGGWVSTNYAATACIRFPDCQASYWPEMDFKSGFNIFQEIGPNYLGGQLDSPARTAIHYTHRLGALGVILVFLVTAIALWRSCIQCVRPWVMIILSLLSLQILLGITNVLANLPLSVAVAHNLVAALLLLSVVTLLYRLYSGILINNNNTNKE